MSKSSLKRSVPRSLLRAMGKGVLRRTALVERPCLLLG